VLSRANALDGWLNLLRKESPHFDLIDIPDGGGWIQNLALASAEYCTVCESRAFELETAADSNVRPGITTTASQETAGGAIQMNPPSRFEIEKLANEKFQADLERRITGYAQKQARALAQVRSRGNSGGYLPALIECKQECLRTEILALADAWVEAGTIYAVPLPVWAEKALEKAAAEMAAGTASALRGELDLHALRTRTQHHPVGEGELRSTLNSALRQGKLRIKTQRIQAERSLRDVPASGLQSGTEPPKVSSVAGGKPGRIEPAQRHPAKVATGADGSGANWQAIEISFLSDHRVQIRNGTNTETRNYGELGFADRRAKQGKPKPNQAWVTLRAMAEQNGIIRDGATTGATWPKVEKRIQEIRKVLRKQFSITADPIPFVEGTGYQARFKIGCSPSFHT
jgi:hypothetical protein